MLRQMTLLELISAIFVVAWLMPPVCLAQSGSPKVKMTPVQIKVLLGRANRLFKAIEYKEAIVLYSRVLEADPNCGEAHLQRGRLLYQLNDTKGAMSDFDQATKDPKQLVNALRERVRVHMEKRQYETALQDANRLMVASHDDAGWYTCKGEILLKLKKYPELIEWTNAGIKKKPINVPLHHMRAQAYLNLKQYQLALNDANKTISLPSGRFTKKEFYETRAKIHAAMGRKDLAAADTKKANEDVEFMFKNALFSEDEPRK